MKISFDSTLCKGCGLCVEACPQKIIAIDKGNINSKGYNPAFVEDQDKCRQCGICYQMCPDVVINIPK